ncbi:MarR family transcriptional regulator [Serratia sp. S1B]|nr:MarR family transcriptional regulator [Serratia sp. S1B]
MSKKYAKYLPASDNIQTSNFPFYWITQIHQKYVENVDHVLKKYGMDNSRRRVLAALLTRPNASVSELSEVLISKMSTTTKLVYRLKDEGYVDTHSCPEDARITRVVLTEKGEEMLKKINDLTGIVLEEAFTGLTPLQIEKLLAQLQHIFKNLSH